MSRLNNTPNLPSNSHFSSRASSSTPPPTDPLRPSSSSVSLSRRTFRANSATPSSFPSNPSLPSLNPFPRLNTSSRKPSQASTSGTSTPDAYRNRLLRRAQEREKNGLSNGIGTSGIGGKGGKEVIDEDWAGVEPDEVFRRLPVGDVRKVEGKMRGEAMGKQSELRSMVGARYREVLTSATHVTVLYESSSRLSSSLRTVAKACRNPNDMLGSGGDETEDGSEMEDAIALLPVAAHLKLLLDAPEALYSYIAKHEYLNAAFLWLVTRVVKENLAKMPEDLNAPYLPLLSKQWEILLPFRSQITSKATASLRSRQTIAPSTLSQTLLSLILLDNLPLSEALSLLLAQRTKAVTDILDHPESPSASGSTLLAKKSRRRASSAASTTNRRDARERGHITKVLSEAIHSVLDTVSSVKAIFGSESSRKGEESESTLDKMVKSIQVGQPAPIPQPVPARRNSHTRRASRLASFSLPVGTFQTTTDGPPVTAMGVIATLPSAQILLRHLPNTITGFTPFIASSSVSSLSESLGKWQEKSIELLKEALPGWLTDLGSVSDVWSVRGVVGGLLDGGEEGGFKEGLKGMMEEEWAKRVRVVWKEGLGAMVSLAEGKIREAAEEIRANGKGDDINPEAFLFSDLTLPTAPSLSTNNISLLSFTTALRKRSAYRTPLLDSVLSTLETKSQEIKKDIQGLPSYLYDDYSQQVRDALDKLVRCVERVLESVGSIRGDGKEGVEAELFVGRVALYLGKSSGFLGDLTEVGSVDTAPTVEALVKVHAISVSSWHKRSIDQALVLLAPIFDPDLTPSILKSTWQADHPTQPSSEIFMTLHALVGSARLLGIPPSLQGELPIVKDLVEGFVDQAKGLEGWEVLKEESVLQGCVDLGFLGLIKGENLERTVMVLKMMKTSNIPQEFKSNLAQILFDSLRRTQLLFSPILSHLPSDFIPPSTPSQGISGLQGSAFGSSGVGEGRNGLLRFGVPSAGGIGGGGEFRSPVAVVKPGKRFGLLSVGL